MAVHSQTPHWRHRSNEHNTMWALVWVGLVTLYTLAPHKFQALTKITTNKLTDITSNL